MPLTDDDFYSGDPRRCSNHPWVRTSSNNGLHDAPCGECEFEMADAAMEDRWNALPQEERDAIEKERAEAAKERAEAWKAEAEGEGIPF